MNSATSNATMPEAASQPEMPNVEPRPPQPEAAETERQVHPGAELGWTDHGGMVEQQASAMEWVRASSEASRDVAGEGERAAVEERSIAAEMTDSRQAQYSRWTGEPLGETAGVTQSAEQGQSQ
jgi:hypothetical protein